MATRKPAGPTRRRRHGDLAEAYVAERLTDAGWRILARGVSVGRDEVDLVAIEPGPDGGPGTLVFVEVRSSRTPRFGAPEESVVGRKVARAYRSALGLVSAGRLPDGRPLPRLPWRVDVVSVVSSDDPTGDPSAVMRHLRGVTPG